MAVRELPMFPLGSVLVPSMLLPLHLFEPRYLAMIETVLASAERSFGVVLIERGHEVGGEDQRSGIGTLARVLQSERADDGRWGVLSVGVGRIRVQEWLPDDPYPRALVDDWPDDDEATSEQHEVYQTLLAQHRRLLGVTAELGHDVGELPELTNDPGLGTFQIAATAPLATLDRFNILAAPTLTERLPVVASSLESALALAEMQMAQAVMDQAGDDEP